jgi:alpha-amylase
MKRFHAVSFYWCVCCAFLLASCSPSRVVSTPQPATVTAARPTQLPPTATLAPTPIPVAPFPVGVVQGLPQGSDGFPWWDDTTFYEIFVRSFFDSNGDGIGDLQGIIQKLDYLNDGNPATHTDLGITGIWLMPIFPSPSYHGYDVNDYMAVNPDYGTLDDLKQLLQEAHERGIHIILDMPLNHTSTANTWFQKSLDPNSSYRNWYIWSDSDPGYAGPWGEQVWHPSPTGKGYYYGVFDSSMPDLNYANPEVLKAVQDVLRFWLQDVGVDGFRFDGARYLVEDGKTMADSPDNHVWFQQMRMFIKGIDPQALLLGEVWTDDFTVSTYMKGDQLDLAFDFDLANAMLTSANLGSAEKADNQLTFSLKTFPDGSSAPFLANHDMDRTASQLGGDTEKAKNAALMLLTSEGVPFVYYGEEIGMQGKRGSENTDINRRLPMQWTAADNAGFTSATPWNPVYPFHAGTNVAFENSPPDSLLNLYRRLILLRSQHVGLRIGDTYKVSGSDPSIYATLRASQDEQLLVLVNLSAQPVQRPVLALKTGRLAGSYHVVPLLGDGSFQDLTANQGGGFDSYQPLALLPPNARLIFQLQPVK